MKPLKQKYRTFLLLVLIIILQLIIYLPHVGTGFVKDDLVWLDSILTNGEVDYHKAFYETTGFYRPLVGLSFALQFEWFETNSRPYGFFNLLLHILNIILVYLLLSSIIEFKPYALLVVFLFTMSVKSSTMSVGWISGRTTLLFTFFSLLSFYLYLKRKQPFFSQGHKIKLTILYFGVGIFFLAALMSKESAVALPIFMVLVNFLDLEKKRESSIALFSGFISYLKRFSKAVFSASIFILPIFVYFYFRLKSNAFTPFNTPEYYRYTLDPLILVKNLLEYIFRSVRFDFFLCACLAIVLLVLKRKIHFKQKLNRRILLFGICWFVIFILPMLPLAIRSDIYVYLPQLGLHLILAVLTFSLWQAVFLENKSFTLRFVLLVPLLILIIGWLGYFWSRTSGYGKRGEISSQFSRDLLEIKARIKKNSRILVIDIDKDDFLSLTNCVAYGFNSLLKTLYA